MHGHLSFHPQPRVESAKARPNFQSNTSIFDVRYGAPSLNTFDPKDFKNRNLRSQIDFGNEYQLDYKPRERHGWDMDSSKSQQRAKDHMYSDIFHTKFGDEAAAQRPVVSRQKHPKDVE